MKVLAAIDSFKGSASSKELNQAVLEGLTCLDVVGINVPVADGGEGTMAAVYEAIGGNYREINVVDLVLRPHRAEYLIIEWLGKKTALIESAEVLGINLVQPSDATIRQATSYGLGLLVQDALDQAVEQIIVTLGGSGTSDGGIGFLQALGATLVHNDSRQFGNPLLSTAEIDLATIDSRIKNATIIIAADVTNPYTGAEGAAHIFGPQKGGTQATLNELDRRAKHIATQVFADYGIDLNQIPGSGAAGGLGGALLLLGATMRPGFDLINQITDLEAKIRAADFIFTGEGRLDQQTVHGKVPSGVARLAHYYNKPVVALCGSRPENLGEMAELLTGAFSIQLGPQTLKEAMKKQNTLSQIRSLVPSIMQIYLKNRK